MKHVDFKLTVVKMSMSVELNYLASTTLIKISILCFYRRITGSLKTAFVYSIWVMIAFCAIYAIIFGFLLVSTCDPVVGTFHLFGTSYQCADSLRHTLTFAPIFRPRMAFQESSHLPRRRRDCCRLCNCRDVSRPRYLLATNLPRMEPQDAKADENRTLWYFRYWSGHMRLWYLAHILRDLCVLLHLRHHLVCVLRLDMDSARS